MKRVLALAVLFAGVPVAGQGLDERLAVTNALADANEAALWFLDGQPKALLRVMVVSPKKFDGVFRAAKAATSATEAGISFRDYQAAIAPLLSESAIITDLAETHNEKFLASAFSATAKIFGAAGRYWGTSIRSGTGPGDLLPIAFTIARKVLDEANATYLRNLKALPAKQRQRAWPANPK